MVDSCIEALILRGAIQMGRFLEDGPSVIDCIRWYAADGTVIASTRASPASTPQLQNGVAAATGSCPFGAAARMLASIVRLLRKTATALRVISKRAMYILWMYAVQAVRWALRQLRSLVEAKNSESSSSSTSIQNDFSVKKFPGV